MSLIERDRAHLWHPYAPASPTLPLWEVEDASGVTLRLKDDDGARHEVVDAMSSWWSAIHGYRHPTLDDAARRQLSRLSHVMFGGLAHEPAVELAERLVAMAPADPARPPLARVFLADSGWVSVDVALKLAVQYQSAAGRPRRQHICGCSRSKRRWRSGCACQRRRFCTESLISLLTRRDHAVAAIVDAEQLRQLLEDAEELADIRAVDAAWEETERLRETPIPWEDVKRDLGLE